MRNEDALRRMLFLNEYKNTTANKEKIKESIDSLLESRATEDEARGILKRGGAENPDALINQFKGFNQGGKLIPLMAHIYQEQPNVEIIGDFIQSLTPFIESGKLPIPVKTKAGYQVKDQTFDKFLRFEEYIHQLESMEAGVSQWKGNIDQYKGAKADPEDILYPEDKNPVADIVIYDGNDVGKCITYGAGGLTGKPYKFCIGWLGAQNRWQSYRDDNSASYYYIVDNTRDKETDPFHIVVWMPTPQGTLITHEPNSTQSEHGFDQQYAKPALGMGYREYLESKGVPVDKIMPNVPKTPEEEADTAKFGSQNTDLEWFKKLDFDEMMRYIGRGHLLSDEQFNYIWGYRNRDSGFNLLTNYLSLGQAIPEAQFNILVGGDEQEPTQDKVAAAAE